MTVQAMEFTLMVNGETVENGMVNGVGNSVLEMTDNIVAKLVGRFGVDGLEMEYKDVSNVWMFKADMTDYNSKGELVGNVYEMEFKPVGMNADKFGLED